MRDRSGEVTVHVPTAAVMDPERIAALVDHRSMRIDGPAFRGRPLGHRLDPLRSVLASPPGEVWVAMVTGVLRAHDFREIAQHQIGDLAVLHGTIAQTLLWQSPTFAEYGYIHPDDVRDEPALEQVFCEVCVILDSTEDRASFTDEEAAALSEFIDAAADNGVSVVLFFRSRDLSGTGGLWRSTVRASVMADRYRGWHQLGLEALTFLVLTATLVYLEFALELDWDHANYLG